jgi:hypothetical protein
MGTRLDPAANERAAFRASLRNFLAYVMSPEEVYKKEEVAKVNYSSW